VSIYTPHPLPYVLMAWCLINTETDLHLSSYLRFYEKRIAAIRLQKQALAACFTTVSITLLFYWYCYKRLHFLIVLLSLPTLGLPYLVHD
jgi:hypothetical protein